MACLQSVAGAFLVTGAQRKAEKRACLRHRDFFTSRMTIALSGGLDIKSRRIITCGSNASVVVTRERGKNGKLINALGARGITCLELPLIEHRKGVDIDKLGPTIRGVEFDWIVLTSPEAAAVFISGWRDANRPKVRLAVVGQGTGEVFDKVTEGREKLEIVFSPSKSTAKVLAAELPKLSNGVNHVLYPASAKAGKDLEIGLSERNFTVLRLDTYSTESVKSLDEEKVAAALSTPVATFASPTAVKAWMKLVGPWDGAAACIGSTSAQAAKKAGLLKVFFPESPGIEGWVDSILEALSTELQETIRTQYIHNTPDNGIQNPAGSVEYY